MLCFARRLRSLNEQTGISLASSLLDSRRILIRRQTVVASIRTTFFDLVRRVVTRSKRFYLIAMIVSQAARFLATYLINDRIVRIEMALEGTYSLWLSFVSQRDPFVDRRIHTQ